MNITIRKLSQALFILIFLGGSLIGYQPVAAQPAPADVDAASDWSMFQHDASHSGSTPSTVVTNQPLYLQWAYSFGERVEVEAQPVISAGVVYQGVMNGDMVALDAATGSARWVRRPGGPIPHTAAVADTTAGKLVFFGSLDGNVYALATATGNTVWTFQTGGPVVSAPVVARYSGNNPQDILYIGSNDGALYALNAATGEQVWAAQTDGPVASSPAVYGDRVYFGSEDLHARAANALSGSLLWSRQLYGVGMTNTYPVISPNGSVVIFVTKKPGVSSYVPVEAYPNVSSSANPVSTWNSYYNAHPTYRNLYYLDAASGADKWNAGAQTYSPMPLPYWGLIHPIIGPDGAAYFPAAAGSANNAYELDHDDRLFRIDLNSGVTTQVGGGPNSPEFQIINAEAGRHTFAGSDYLYTISEDLAVFHYSGGNDSLRVRTLFANGSDPTGFSFGTHMDPLSPLPTRHVWRYGGAVAMGGVPGASAPIVYNGLVYYNSYGWIYALGTQNKGYNPATSFTSRDTRRYAASTITYLRDTVLTPAQMNAELERRVDAYIARGPDNLPVTARYEQPGVQMINNETNYETYSMPHETVRVLSEAYPYLSTAKQAALKTYLQGVNSRTLLNANFYAYEMMCIIYGEAGIKTTRPTCTQSGKILSAWLMNNPNIIAQNLYALSVYAKKTGDWSSINSKWSLITQQFQSFVSHYNSSLGFSVYDEWLTNRLNLPAQIAMAQGVRDMAVKANDANTRNSATTLLNNLLNTRVRLAGFVQTLYDNGTRQSAQIRLNPNGTIVNSDVVSSYSPYNDELIPYDAALRDRNTDSSQVNWLDTSGNYRVDAGTGFMYYPVLSGYFPMSTELANRLNSSLLEKTRYYVKSYEVNQPWWWMTDQAHHTTGSGEHLYTSPALSWSLFQTKAYVLKEPWDTLAAELPEPVSFNSVYDPYRIENLATVLELYNATLPNLSTSTVAANPSGAFEGQTVQFLLTLRNTGASLTDPTTVTIEIPDGLNYIGGSLQASLGSANDSNPQLLAWNGVMNATASVTIRYNVTVNTPDVVPLSTPITISGPKVGTIQQESVVIANGYSCYLPSASRQ